MLIHQDFYSILFIWYNFVIYAPKENLGSSLQITLFP